METDFYAVSAQILVVLILALTIESKLSKVKTKIVQTWIGVITAFNQVAVYVWGTMGLIVSMFRLGEFSVIGNDGGKVAVLFSIATILTYLLSQLLINHSTEEKYKLSVGLVSLILFTAGPWVFSDVLVNYAHPMDGILIVGVGIILSLIAIRTVAYNKQFGPLFPKKR